VEHPVDLSLEQLKAFTQHFWIPGWSGVAKWGGVSMQSIVDLVAPRPEAKWASSTRSAKKPKRRQPAG
jgi:methionine sulfoxide reductase catalytic subunit